MRSLGFALALAALAACNDNPAETAPFGDASFNADMIVGAPDANIDAPSSCTTSNGFVGDALRLDCATTDTVPAMLSTAAEGIYSERNFQDTASERDASEIEYLALAAELPFAGWEFAGGSANQWMHTSAGSETGADLPGYSVACPSRTGVACEVNPPACLECPASQRRGLYVWQGDVDYANAHGWTGTTLLDVAVLAHGATVYDHAFWDDYVAMMRGLPSFRASLVFNVANWSDTGDGTTEARAQVDALAAAGVSIRDVSLGVEQRISYRYGSDTTAGTHYVDRARPYARYVADYNAMHGTDIKAFAYIPDQGSGRGASWPPTCDSDSGFVPCWNTAVAALLAEFPGLLGIQNNSHVHFYENIADDEALRSALFSESANGSMRAVHNEWAAYATIFPGVPFVVSQFSVQGGMRGIRNFAEGKLGEALFVAYYAFDALAFNRDGHAGFLHTIKYYNGRDLIQPEDNTVGGAYVGLSLLKPAFQGNAQLLYLGSCPGEATTDLPQRRVVAVAVAGMHYLYVVNFRDTESAFSVIGALAPATMAEGTATFASFTCVPLVHERCADASPFRVCSSGAPSSVGEPSAPSRR